MRLPKAFPLFPFLLAGCVDSSVDLSSDGNSVRRVAVRPDTVRIVQGDSLSLEAAAYASHGDEVPARFAWRSLNPSVLAVDESGLARARGVGWAKALARAGDHSDTAFVEVEPEVRRIDIRQEPPGPAIRGDSIQFLAAAIGSGGDTLERIPILWSSSDEAIARVDTAGLVVALEVGTVAIIARAQGIKAQADLVVAPRIARLEIAAASAVLGVDDTLRAGARAYDEFGRELSGIPVQWATSDVDIAVVDQTGLVRGRSVGSAKITAAAQRASDSLVVSVKSFISRISVAPKSDTIAPGDTVRLAATAYGPSGEPVPEATFLWSTSDTSVLSVGDSGVASGVAKGVAVVLAKVGGLSGSALISVRPKNMEREALQAFFDGTGGLGWRLSRGWLGDGAVSGWHGVSVDTLMNVTWLDLSDNNLSGTLPWEIGDFSSLRGLDVSGNPELRGPLPRSLMRTGVFSIAYENTGLCAPVDSEFQEWLAEVARAGPDCEQRDRAVLEELYEALGGKRWRRNGFWGSEEALGEWHGVEVDSAGRVTALRLQYNWLEGGIPAALGKLSELRVLDLAGNRLSGPIPHSLSNLARLRELLLSGNRLSGSIPPSLERLDSLERFSVGSNRLSGRIPDFSHAPGLRMLRLDGNEFSGPIPARLGDLRQLRELDLEGNRLVGEIPDGLGDLQALERLALGGNQLGGPIPAQLGNLGQLLELGLEENRLSGSLPGDLGRLAKLQALRAFGNQLSGEIPRELGELSSLVHLGLSDNQLSGSLPATFGKLDRLERLSLSGNALSGSLPKELANASSLSALSLRHNRVTGIVPEEWTRLKLVRLDLSATDACTLLLPEVEEWILGIRVFASEGACSQATMDREALQTLYDSAGGPGWTGATRWRSDRPVGAWKGVGVDHSGRVVSVKLEDASLEGELPSRIRYLRRLREIDLSGNAQLAGGVPATLGELDELDRVDFAATGLSGQVPDAMTQLGGLTEFSTDSSGLCTPPTATFRAWLEKIAVVSVAGCENPELVRLDIARVEVVQAIQSDAGDVPLVEKRPALMRVYVTGSPKSYFEPTVSATLFFGASPVRTYALEPRARASIPEGVEPGSLANTYNLRIPGRYVIPGLRYSVRVDPKGVLPTAPESRTRFPASGSQEVPVASPPPMGLTVVPIISTRETDSSTIAWTRGLTAEDERLSFVRSVLPIGKLDLTVREPYVTNLDLSRTATIYRMLNELVLLRKLEESSDYYYGVLPTAATGVVGVAATTGPLVSLGPAGDPVVMAHELGHNMDLRHAPCGAPPGSDGSFPYRAGRIGGWGVGLDPTVLHEPNHADVMSYCTPAWISDYHFRKALEFRVERELERAAPMALASSNRHEVGWYFAGFVDESGGWELEPAVFIPLGFEESPQQGSYRLSGYSESGAQLFSRRLEPILEAESGRAFFSLTIPGPESWSRDLRRIALQSPKGVLAERAHLSGSARLRVHPASGNVLGIERTGPPN